MTDQVMNKKGWGKAGAAWIALEIAQHVNPLLVSYLTSKFFFLNETIASELVIFLESGLGMFFVWATPAHFVAFISDIILFVRSAWKQWRDDWTKPNP